MAASVVSELLALATKYGLGTLLAILLVYKLAFDFEASLDALDAKVDAHVAAADKQSAVQILLLRAICEHTATTEAERAVCREAGR